METTEQAKAKTPATHSDNPLLGPWRTPHATPPFALIAQAHFVPAMRAAIASAQTLIRHIADNKEPPTFLNTVAALERAGELPDRIGAVLFNLDECNTDDELSDIVMLLTPELTRFENDVWMNERLFARVEEVYRHLADTPLSSEEEQLLKNTRKTFLRSGVQLPPADKETFRSNSEELARLAVLFNKNVLADTKAFALNVTDISQLDGIPADVLTAAGDEARKRGQQGWTLTLDYPVYGPVVDHADSRSLREQMWKAYNSRGNHGDGNDNGNIIRRMTLLRQQQARLLGYDDYLSYRLDDSMAKRPATLSDFMTRMLHAAHPAALRDLQEVQDWMAAHGNHTPLQHWDFNYYAEKMKQDRYSFDGEQLRPYFQLEKVRQGIFDLYGKLYGVAFLQVHDIDTYRPDVTTFEVRDGDRFLGVLYLDMFPRPGKRGGAWMTEFRSQHRTTTEDIRPLVQVVCNFTKPVEDKPALLSFGEVHTLMHETGHAMHSLLSDVHYASLSGTNVDRDFVEMPSQLMENWCAEPSFLHTFAHHYQTGEPLPDSLINKLNDSRRYMAGWLCLRQLNLGLVDIAFHTQTKPLTGRVDAFEHRHMVELLPPVEGCNTSTAFTHIFCGGYSAAYYSYKWSEMLDADIFCQFKEHGLFDRDTALRFRRDVLSQGGTAEPDLLFRRFMGRNPDPHAYLLRDGLEQPSPSPIP